jgi:chromosome segregation ATPase
MDNPIESKESLSLELCRDLITDLQSENSDLKNKLAVVNELLRRFKLNEVTELNKQIVKITQKDLLTQLKIMKENSEAQSRASFLQQEEIHQLKTQLSYFESQSPKKSDPCKQSSKENLYSELESCRFSLKTLENELKFYKLQLSNHDSLKSENFQMKSELEELKQKFDLKEDNFKTFSLKQSSLQKKLDLLIKEKKLLEEKISELESDKRKLLEKWQR